MASDTATASPETEAPARRRLWPQGSRLGRLIIALNFLGLAILVIGALTLNEMRRGLVNARIESLITQGVTIAETTVVLPFDYLRLVYAALFGWLLFNEVPGPWSLTGAFIIVASTLYILLLEAKKKATKP